MLSWILNGGYLELRKTSELSKTHLVITGSDASGAIDKVTLSMTSLSNRKNRLLSGFFLILYFSELDCLSYNLLYKSFE
jgi:hypothetical protein